MLRKGLENNVADTLSRNVNATELENDEEPELIRDHWERVDRPTNYGKRAVHRMENRDEPIHNKRIQLHFLEDRSAHLSSQINRDEQIRTTSVWIRPECNIKKSANFRKL